ncbi:MAG: sigma-54-dependent Fis family transcriptional regulator [Deltaproteobacteria bacterium]|nr:MAG: sigma-54-dependent Fis family transcriptional regulator [Deltaproteobacteria bacterium]
MTRSARIMVVDDEKIVRESLSAWLQKSGYDAVAVDGGQRALELLEREEWDLLLVDLKMPRVDGLKVLRRTLESKSDIPVLIFTAYATVETAVEAMKAGAYDYLVKPIDPDVLAMKVEKIVERQNLARENVVLRRKIDSLCQFDEIIGNSRPMQQLLELVGSVADSDATVLVTGESGTGKELIARAIHRNSKRRYKPFIAVSVGALPASLVESEMFGYEKGAFTGADHRHLGKFEMADGGTLFLDEIAELAAKVQVDLLRVLEEHSFFRLGGDREIGTDARVIAATNRDLRREVEQGTFREDLYYRLNVIEVHLPPLRERGDDVILLAEHFLKKYSTTSGRKKDCFTPQAITRLRDYYWPGNVRELENTIERAVLVGKGAEVQVQDLWLDNEHHQSAGQALVSLREAEKKHIVRVLEENGWNITRSARILQIDRATLYNKLKQYRLSRPRKQS